MDDRNTGDTRNASPPPDGGGEVRIAQREGRSRRSALLYKALALVLIAACVGYVVVRHRAASDTRIATHDAQHPSATSRSVANAGGPMASDVIEARRMPDRDAAARPAISAQDLNRDLSEFYVPGQPVPTMGEVIDRLHKAGVRTGLGAFSPPGTSPPLVGIAVPEDFPLPEGYVRHFQATDDGQPIDAILMFSPDFAFFDESGRPIAIPPNRVVPPELAPPGLAIRLIEIPRPLDTGAAAPGTPTI